MKTALPALSLSLLATTLVAQSPDFLYTTSQNELTLTNSGGTVLRNIRPNDIVGMPAFPCPGSAEKWAPRQAFETMAGDEDGDDDYFEPALFGAIDALMISRTTAAGLTNARNVWYSVSVPMGTTISGGPGLRPATSATSCATAAAMARSSTSSAPNGSRSRSACRPRRW